MSSVDELNQKAHLLIVKDDKPSREFLLSKKSTYSLGRAEQCDIRIYCPFVSRHHATLIRQCDEDGSVHYQIFDGDGQNKLSKYGILINGHKVNDYKLKDGDKVVFAPQVFAIYQHLDRYDPESIEFII